MEGGREGGSEVCCFFTFTPDVENAPRVDRRSTDLLRGSMLRREEKEKEEPVAAEKTCFPAPHVVSQTGKFEKGPALFPFI
jgi:hypothetical protein